MMPWFNIVNDDGMVVQQIFAATQSDLQANIPVGMKIKTLIPETEEIQNDPGSKK